MLAETSKVPLLGRLDGCSHVAPEARADQAYDPIQHIPPVRMNNPKTEEWYSEALEIMPDAARAPGTCGRVWCHQDNIFIHVQSSMVRLCLECSHTQ